MTQKEKHYHEPEKRHSPVIQKIAKNVTWWSMKKTQIKMWMEIIAHEMLRKGGVLSRLLFSLICIVIIPTGAFTLPFLLILFLSMDMIIMLPYWIITGKDWDMYCTHSEMLIWWINFLSWLEKKLMMNTK